MQSRQSDSPPNTRRYSYPRDQSGGKELNKLSTSTTYTSAHRSLPIVTLNAVDTSDDGRRSNQHLRRDNTNYGNTSRTLSGINTNLENDSSQSK